MITIKEYYSDVIQKDDENIKVRCNWCMNVFPAYDILLNIQDEENEEHEEYCPFCKKNGYLMDLD